MPDYAKPNASTAKRAVRKAANSNAANVAASVVDKKYDKSQEEVVNDLRNGIMPSRNYCSKSELYKEIKDYQDRQKKNPNAKMSDRLGIMIWQMAIKISGHSNFRHYPSCEKDEIVECGIAKMVDCVDKFDTSRPELNPFGYLTTCCFNAMKAACKRYYRRINTERDIRQKFVTDGEAALDISASNPVLKPENYPQDFRDGHAD